MYITLKLKLQLRVTVRIALYLCAFEYSLNLRKTVVVVFFFFLARHSTSMKLALRMFETVKCVSTFPLYFNLLYCIARATLDEYVYDIGNKFKNKLFSFDFFLFFFFFISSP